MYSEIRSGTMGRKRGAKQVTEECKTTILDIYAVGVKQMSSVTMECQKVQ